MGPHSRALRSAVAHYPGPPEALAALGELDGSLLEALLSRGKGQLSAMRIADHCDCPRTVQRLYELGALEERFPPVDPAPSVVDYGQWLARKHSPEDYLPGEFFARAVDRGRPRLALWVKRHFSFDDAKLNGAMYDAALEGNLAAAKWIFAHFPGDWEELRYQADDPFRAAMVEDHFRVAAWLADNVYPRQGPKVRADRGLFRDLIFLNNVPAVEWLVEKYAVPLEGLFEPRTSAAVALYAMDRSGRRALAQYLSRHYGVTPEVGTLPNARQAGLEQPPPKTKGFEALRERID